FSRRGHATGSRAAPDAKGRGTIGDRAGARRPRNRRRVARRHFESHVRRGEIVNDFILIALKILAVLALVLLNGFFVAAEFSLVRIRETQLDTLVAKNWRRAKMARHIVRNLNSYLSATQLGITMVSLGLGYLGEPIFSSLLAPVFGWFGLESSEWV